MKITFKKTAMALAAVATLGASTAATAAELRFYNWSDYIAEDTIEKFTAATGIDVIYDMFDSNEVLEAKVLTGQSGYDLVVPTSDFMARQIQAGAYQKLDKSKIPNFKNLDPKLMAILDSFDPGAEYSVPYLWGTTGIGYNVEKVAERLGEDFDTVTWDMVFDPAVISKLADCGVTMLDAPSEIYLSALTYLGLDPYTRDQADFDKATELLMSVRKYVTYFHSSNYITDLANGDICVAVGWSGDIFMAGMRAEEAENGNEIAYVIPKEGALLWSDMLVIPASANNVDEAHEMINFILDAQIGGDITNYVWYASPNLAAHEFIDPEILEHPGIFPGAETKLIYNEVRPKKIDRVITRGWTKVKSSQ